MFDRYTLGEHLKNGVVTVVFEKLDGSLREMRCTLKPESLPQLLQESETPRRAVNDDVMAVWDLDNGGWRSFRLDSVKRIVIG